MSVGILLGGPDRASIMLIEKWPGGLVYKPGAGTAGRTKIAEHFENGSSVFIDGDDLERYFVQRVRNYAHVESLATAEIRHAVVSGDCHDGYFVNVADAASRIKWFKKMNPEQYEKHVFGRDFGFPPFCIGCDCRMAGLIEGAEDFHRLNTDRKVWRWFKRRFGRR